MSEKRAAPAERLREIAALATLAADRWPRDGDINEAHEALGYAEDNLHEIEAVLTDGVGFDRAEAARSHRMVPGTHERQDGPECACGRPWSRWDDACAAGDS